MESSAVFDQIWTVILRKIFGFSRNQFYISVCFVYFPSYGRSKRLPTQRYEECMVEEATLFDQLRTKSAGAVKIADRSTLIEQLRRGSQDRNGAEIN